MPDQDYYYNDKGGLTMDWIKKLKPGDKVVLNYGASPRRIRQWVRIIDSIHINCIQVGNNYFELETGKHCGGPFDGFDDYYISEYTKGVEEIIAIAGKREMLAAQISNKVRHIELTTITVDQLEAALEALKGT